MMDVRLSSLLEVFRDGDERGWAAEFDFLWSEHRERMDELAASIQADGIHTPILLGSDGRVWDGHHRLAVAHQLGVEFVPVEFAGGVAQSGDYHEGLEEGIKIGQAQRPAISPEVRGEVRSAVGSVLANASNYPEATQPHILGRDLSELIDATTDALLARFALPELDPEKMTDANPCGDWPAPCNCDDPDTHDLTKGVD